MESVNSFLERQAISESDTRAGFPYWRESLSVWVAAFSELSHLPFDFQCILKRFPYVHNFFGSPPNYSDCMPWSLSCLRSHSSRVRCCKSLVATSTSQSRDTQTRHGPCRKACQSQALPTTNLYTLPTVEPVVCSSKYHSQYQCTSLSLKKAGSRTCPGPSQDKGQQRCDTKCSHEKHNVYHDHEL
jgi:hypothetical protein